MNKNVLHYLSLIDCFAGVSPFRLLHTTLILWPSGFDSFSLLFSVSLLPFSMPQGFQSLISSSAKSPGHQPLQVPLPPGGEGAWLWGGKPLWSVAHYHRIWIKSRRASSGLTLNITHPNLRRRKPSVWRKWRSRPRRHGQSHHRPCWHHEGSLYHLGQAITLKTHLQVMYFA